jgi:hypothetical protein
MTTPDRVMLDANATTDIMLLLRANLEPTGELD